MMRVVFDTNLIVSGSLWSGTPRIALQFGRTQRITVLTSEALIDELRDVLARDKFQRFLEKAKTTPEKLVTDYLSFAHVINPAPVKDTTVRDPDDLKVLAVAISGKADYIVSGDDDLLSLGVYKGISILKVGVFVARITSDG